MKRFLLIFSFLILFSGLSQASGSQWDGILEKAKGQTVYFNAWGGSQPVNDYITWAASRVEEQFNVKVVHVKAADISQVVSRILVEKSAGKTENGSVDLMWINGENFRSMKENQLLYGPFSDRLPHYSLVDTQNKKALVSDFTTPVENMESPWGMAQLVFMADTERVEKFPASMADLLSFARQNPGRFTYPAIPAFHGTTFVKQALIELVTDPIVLTKPVVPEEFQTRTASLWAFLDELHPLLWRKGTSFPTGAPQMIRLLNDSEIFISLSFNPNAASNAIQNGELPESVRTYVHAGGTIGNAHFVAIPFNATAREGAMVFANFLLSPEAQARKSDPAVWGDPTVLNMSRLAPRDKALFDAVPRGVATLSAEDLGAVLPEPHVSWVDALEKEWLRRYSR
jgi:putative thiamine transport system substrate-binding protein